MIVMTGIYDSDDVGDDDNGDHNIVANFSSLLCKIRL